MNIFINIKQKSMINTLNKTSRSRSYPVILFNIHVFPLPLYPCEICWRSRSYFKNLLLWLTLISKFRIWSKSILIFFFLSLLLSSCYSIKSWILKRTRAIRRGTRYWSIFLCIVTLLFAMFSYPKLVSCFVHFKMRHFKMRIMTSHSWRLSWIKLMLFIEKSLISNFLFSSFQCLKLFFDLFISFI